MNTAEEDNAQFDAFERRRAREAAAAQTTRQRAEALALEMHGRRNGVYLHHADLIESALLRERAEAVAAERRAPVSATPDREKAEDFASGYFHRGHFWGEWMKLASDAERLCRWARTQEREACITIIDTLRNGYSWEQIIAAIRTRPTAKESTDAT